METVLENLVLVEAHISCPYCSPAEAHHSLGLLPAVQESRAHPQVLQTLAVEAETGSVVVHLGNHTAAVDDEVGGAGAVAETVEDKGHLGNDPLAADFVKGEAVVAAVVVVWVVAVPVVAAGQ